MKQKRRRGVERSVLVRAHLCSVVLRQTQARSRLDRESRSRAFPTFGRLVVTGLPRPARNLVVQPVHIGNPKKYICLSGSFRLVGLKMKPHAIPRNAEIARVGLARRWWIGEHLLKSQDSTVIVFGSGRIGNCYDRNGAGDHDLEGENTFMCLTYRAVRDMEYTGSWR